MKFDEMKYERPDFDAQYEKAKSLMTRMEGAASAEELVAALLELNDMMKYLETQMSLSYVRYTINTKDEFYAAEKEVFDQQLPRFEEFLAKKARLVLNSPFRSDIAEKFGPYLLEKYEVNQKVFTPEILDDLVEENKMRSEYQTLMASAEIEFDGKKYNLTGLGPFMQSTERDTRRRANNAYWNWMAAHAAELDGIYDKLVALRQRMAEKLGYENFVPVAYARMERTDWGLEDARVYRDQIRQYVVPLAQKLYKQQAARLGISDMKNYDYALDFLTGNPKPAGEEAYLVEQAKKMYAELSPETDEFFKVMTSQKLMDLTTKPGKANGGYMTYFPDYKVPFIFSNFNGTSGDVDVLTHEAGHALQGYLQRDVEFRDQTTNTAEVAEIHSMSMEFFTHGWMESFFKEDTVKYYYSHVVDALKFLPYGATIDEFQEWVYLNPGAKPVERNRKFREIERKYLPHIDYDGHEYLENGGFWQKQLHIFLYPHYYLDYTLAQVVAFQYFIWNMKNHAEAWQSYLTLCRRSGLVPFKALLQESGLKDPFVAGTIAAITPELEKYLDSLDTETLK